MRTMITVTNIYEGELTNDELRKLIMDDPPFFWDGAKWDFRNLLPVLSELDPLYDPRFRTRDGNLFLIPPNKEHPN